MELSALGGRGLSLLSLLSPQPSSPNFTYQKFSYFLSIANFRPLSSSFSPSTSASSLLRPDARRSVSGTTRSSSSRRSLDGIVHVLPCFSTFNNRSVSRRPQAENAFVDVELEDEEQQQQEEASTWAKRDDGAAGSKAAAAGDDYGEVDSILASRVSEDRKTEYLILWQDDHPDSWETAENIASDLVAGYETPWWQAARKADAEKLKELLDSEDIQRDVNAIDENERNALLFAAGMGSEKCVRLLVEYGADVYWQDKDGFTPLHIASGYVHVHTVKALVELGADPDLEDRQGRSALSLAQELLARTPRTNPLQFARRMALDQVVKALDEVMYETVEVERVLDKRLVDGGAVEYLVKWSDNSEDGWVSAKDIGEDLIKDYEEGLEYGVVEQVLDTREVADGDGDGDGDGKVEYYVRWSDGKETWETAENVGDEVVADFHASRGSQ